MSTKFAIYIRNGIQLVSACCLLVSGSAICDAQPPLAGKAEPTTAAAQPAAGKEIVAAIPGRWDSVPAVQAVLDDASPNPDYLGRLDKFELQLIDMPKFWSSRELQPVEKLLKRLASERHHKILATGNFGASGDRQPTFGYFMLTHTEGQTFLSVLNIDGGTFTPWRVHFIPGKNRNKDLLFIDIEDPGRRQVVVFRRADQTPAR